MLDALFGNAKELSAEEIQKELEPVLVPGEKIARAFAVFRDLFVFTDKRLILVDKQGATGKKVSYQSIPYTKINRFEVETAGHFDRDAELKLWVHGSSTPIQKEFKKGVDVVGLQKTLAYYVLR